MVKLKKTSTPPSTAALMLMSGVPRWPSTTRVTAEVVIDDEVLGPYGLRKAVDPLGLGLWGLD